MSTLHTGTTIASPPTKRPRCDPPALSTVEPTAIEPYTARAFPTLVPMENEFAGTEYYVRACFADYYRVVMDMLATKRGVTVTGTPGIGKSVLMAYFFERYSREHPHATITMVSYTPKSDVKQVVVVRGGTVVEETYRRATGVMDTTHAIYAEDDVVDPHDLCLLDGLPSMIPHKGVRWVSFTLPDEGWTKTLGKNTSTCRCVYLPVWTLDELRDAACALGHAKLLEPIGDAHVEALGLDHIPTQSDARPALLDCCFAYFGGVARACFVPVGGDMKRTAASLHSAVAGLTLDELCAVVTQRTVPECVYSLFHLVPVEYEYATMRVGSTVIQRLLGERADAITLGNELRLAAMAQFNAAGQSIVAVVVEARVCRVLRAGGTLKTRMLGGCFPSWLEMAVPSACDIVRITDKGELTPLDDPRPRCLAALFYENPYALGRFFTFRRRRTDARVVLFHILVSLTRPVSAHAIATALQALGQWDAVARSPDTAVALVFVVLEGTTKDERTQPVALLEEADGSHEAQIVLRIPQYVWSI